MRYSGRRLIITKDGSHSVSIPEMNVTYHSHHGAIQESRHVFIEAGLKYVRDYRANSDIHVFEMGLGTGLNALLTLIEAEKSRQPVHYTAIELYPLEFDEILSLNYCEQLMRPDLAPLFQTLHQCEWGRDFAVTPYFTLHKRQLSLIDFSTDQHFNLLYYDAFAPAAQPELWTTEIFTKLFSLLLPGGILVTYCSKGDVRRAMEAAGFMVEKIAGPPGKREMVRAARKS